MNRGLRRGAPPATTSILLCVGAVYGKCALLRVPRGLKAWACERYTGSRACLRSVQLCMQGTRPLSAHDLRRSTPSQDRHISTTPQETPPPARRTSLPPNGLCRRRAVAITTASLWSSALQRDRRLTLSTRRAFVQIRFTCLGLESMFAGTDVQLSASVDGHLQFEKER